MTHSFADIHCHLLPGIDDGAEDWEQSLQMARIASSDGISCSIVTPHQLGQYTETTGERIRTLTQQFQERLDNEGIPLKVLPGADVRIDSDMIERLSSGDCISLGDHRRHVLLELPHELYMPLEPVLDNLRSIGMIGILSHPERNEGLLRKPELIEPLVRRGCLMQITADSLKGTFGDAPKNMCQWMLRDGLVHFLASDAHGTRRRRPTLQKSFDIASELVGEQYARALCVTNPRAVAEGRNIPSLPSIQRPSFIQRVFGRKKQAA